MDCPRCFNKWAHGNRNEEIEARGCAACQGVWLSPAAARRMIEGPFGALSKLPRIAAGNAALRCPTCRKALERCRVAEVEIDVCAEHGVWFDHTEVERVHAAARRPRRGDGLATAAVIGTAVAAEVVTSIYAPLSQPGQRPGEGADVGVVTDGAGIVLDVGVTAIDVAVSSSEAIGSAVVEAGALEAISAGAEAVGSGALGVLASLFEGLFSL